MKHLTTPVVPLLLILMQANAAHAQQCDATISPTFFYDQLKDVFRGHGSDCFQSETYFHFSGSRGAFADAFTASGIKSTCPLLDPSGNQLSHCLKYTGDCSSTGVGPHCIDDTLTSSNEISCYCHLVPSQKVADVRPLRGLPSLGWDHNFEGNLWIDENNDGTAERKASRKIINEDVVQPFQVTPVARNTWRLQWEDLFPKDQADFNDYIVTYEVRECTPGRWPLDTSVGVNDCLDECGAVGSPGLCQEGPSGSLRSNLQFHADVTYEYAECVSRGSSSI